MTNRPNREKVQEDWPHQQIQEDWLPTPHVYFEGGTFITAAELARGEKPMPVPDAPPLTARMHIGGLHWERASNIVPESVKWLWPNRIPRGKVSLIGGFPNQGKSQILCNLAAIITRGGEWPNGEGMCEKGAVMILAAEDTAKDMLVPRLIAAGADMDQILIINPLLHVVEEGERKVRVFNIEADLKRLEIAINFEAKRNGSVVKAVLIDPLNAYYGGGKNFDVHKTADMRQMLTPLSQWCGEKDIAVVGIAHFNKANNGHLLYRITDSSAITAVCRAVWFALQDEEDKKYYMVEGKKNVGKTARGIQYNIDDKGIDRLDPSTGVEIVAPFIAWGQPTEKSAHEILGGGKGGPGTGQRDAATEFVVRALRYHGKLKRTTLEKNAKEYGIAPRTLRRAIEGLRLKPIKERFPAVVSYSLDVVWQDTDELTDDPLVDADEPDFG